HQRIKDMMRAIKRPLHLDRTHPQVADTTITTSSALATPTTLETVSETEQTQGRPPARTMVIPHVHQFELHPRLLQKDIIQFCQQHKIQVQAYSSLGEGRLISLTPPPPPAMDPHYNASPMPGALDIMPDLIRKYFPGTGDESGPNDLHNDVMGSEAALETNKNVDVDMKSVVVMESDTSRQKEYSKRAAQILLRWGLQHGAVVIPKSTHPERIRDNINLYGFELDSV
ncbi:hypothetical protein BGX20_006293, partial [Mortierella sp. AD010]